MGKSIYSQVRAAAKEKVSADDLTPDHFRDSEGNKAEEGRQRKDLTRT